MNTKKSRQSGGTYTLQKPIRCALELIDLGLAEIETRKELDIKEMANIDQSIGDV